MKKTSSKTKRALRLILAGEPPYRAAKTVGIDPRTIYRALKRIREGREPNR